MEQFEMNRKISLAMIAVLIIALAYFLPGCDELITETFEITEAGHPRSEFSGDKDAGCAPCTVQFTDESQGPHQLWKWNFGDGKDSVDDSTENPIHIYENEGTFTVSLTIFDTTVSDTGRDTRQKKRFIIIGTATGSIEASDTVGCPGTEVTFTPIDTGGVASYLWSFGDGRTSDSISPTHIYDDTGIYSVTLELTGVDCPNQTIFADSIIRIHYCPEMVIWKDTNFVCIEEGITFVDSTQHDTTLSVIQSRRWKFGSETVDDGNSHLVEFDVNGEIGVSLTTTFEIQTSDVLDTIILTGYDTVTVYDFGLINFTATPNVGCLSDFQQFVVHFTNTTPGDIDSVEWRFGDGYLSYDLEPYHVFNTPGLYKCTLTVYSPCGTGVGQISNSVRLNDSIPTGLTTEEYFTIFPTTVDSADTFFLDAQLGDSLVYYDWTIEGADGNDVVISHGLGIDTTSFVIDGSGIFNIDLKISNECGVVIASDSIEVTSPPEP